MAKPKHGRCGNNHILVPFPAPSNCKRPSHAPVRPFPSPAILSALALIATTPPLVAGGPLPLPTTPPTFLCPSIEHDNLTLPCSPIPSSSAPTPISTSRHSKREVIADRYVQGTDSLWRKTDAWTLYGSICCSTFSTTHSQSTSSTPMPTSSLTTAEFDTSVLPAGWDSANNISPSTDSNIILALAIVLAGSICIFMIGCVVWRRRKKKTKDIERKLGRKLGADDDPQGDARERDPRGKMRMWAKASARWKSNVRLSARRRRKKQAPVAAQCPPSRRDSFVSVKLDPPGQQADSSFDGTLPQLPIVLHDSPRPAPPPTYPGFSPSSTCVPNSNSSPSLDSTDDEPPVIDEVLSYAPPLDGHIATDDKDQLAHIFSLANSPVTDPAGASASQSISAPQLDEVEGGDLEESGTDLGQVLNSHSRPGLPPSFPLPPKGDVLFGCLDGRSPSYDILASHPAPELSGPLTVLSPSAPLVDDLGLEPSAPSLDDEDDLFQAYILGAPTLDSTLPHTTEPSCSSIVTSTSRIPLPTIRESATKDGVLPRYHP